MQSKFDIIFEQVLSTIVESIASRVDELAISGADKEAIKKYNDIRKQNAAIYLFSKGAVQSLDEFERIYATEKDYMKLSSREKAESVLTAQSGFKLAELDAKKFDPATEPAFSSPFDAGDGVVIYTVDKTEQGHVAVRKAVDAAWGLYWNFWCIVSRGIPDSILKDTVDKAKSKAERDAYLYGDTMRVSDHEWTTHCKAGPMRIAYKDGKLLAFYGGKPNALAWWNRHDEASPKIPGCNATDDLELLKKYDKINYYLAADDFKGLMREFKRTSEDNKQSIFMSYVVPDDVKLRLAKANVDYADMLFYPDKLSENLIRAIYADQDLMKSAEMREQLASRDEAPMEILKALAKDRNYDVRETARDTIEMKSESTTR